MSNGTSSNGTTVTVIPCGAMTADLTWLLLAPGRSIRRRQDKNLPAEWVEKLRAIAAKSDATLVFGHDPDQI
jgi:hypothetical protein